MKQKKQLAILIVLLLVAGTIWFFYFDHGKDVVTADAGAAAQTPQPISVENLTLHNDAVGKVRQTEYKSGGRNIFSRELPRPPEPPRHVPKPGDPGNPIVPPVKEIPRVSPLPVKFFGYGTVPNGTARLAFFTDGEDEYVVKEGELLMNRFRILKIGNSSLEYEEVSSGLRGTANLEDQGGPPSA
jgi:hypothetical protein